MSDTYPRPFVTLRRPKMYSSAETRHERLCNGEPPYGVDDDVTYPPVIEDDGMSLPCDGPLTHEAAHVILGRLLERSGYTETRETKRLCQLIMRADTEGLWPLDICVTAFVTRDCPHHHRWTTLKSLRWPLSAGIPIPLPFRDR